MKKLSFTVLDCPNKLVMKLVLLCICVTLCAAAVPYEIFYCFETEDCGLSTLGSYSLETPKINKTVEGYLFSIKNGLPFDITFFWDILTFGDTMNQKPQKKQLKVKANSVKYFDSEVKETHSLRIFVKSFEENVTDYELIDKILAKEEKKCANGHANKICDFLFRLCYQNKFEPKSKCEDYEIACFEFATQTEEEECIESCALTHYSHLLDGAEKVNFKFDRYSIVKALIDHEQKNKAEKKWKKSLGFTEEDQLPADIVEKIAQIKASDDKALSSSSVTVAILITIIVLLILIGTFGIWFWSKSYKTTIVKDYGAPGTLKNTMI